MRLGQAIIKLADERKISKYRIAKNSGLPQATLNEIANGKNQNPTLLTVMKIAEGIGVTVSFLMNEAEDIGKPGEEK